MKGVGSDGQAYPNKAIFLLLLKQTMLYYSINRSSNRNLDNHHTHTFSSDQSSNKSCTPPYQIPPKHEAPLVLSPYKRTQPAEVLPAKPHVRITYGTGKIRMCFKPSMRAANGNRCLEMHRVGPGFEV